MLRAKWPLSFGELRIKISALCFVLFLSIPPGYNESVWSTDDTLLVDFECLLMSQGNTLVNRPGERGTGKPFHYKFNLRILYCYRWMIRLRFLLFTLSCLSRVQKQLVHISFLLQNITISEKTKMKAKIH